MWLVPSNASVAHTDDGPAFGDNESTVALLFATHVVRSPTSSNTTVQKQSILTVSAQDVSIIYAGGTLVPEGNKAICINERLLTGKSQRNPIDFRFCISDRTGDFRS